jgi:hypothetical protein
VNAKAATSVGKRIFCFITSPGRPHADASYASEADANISNIITFTKVNFALLIFKLKNCTISKLFQKCLIVIMKTSGFEPSCMRAVR